MRHITRCLGRARQTGSTLVEITAQANARYFESLLARRDNQIFFQPTCATANSYYLDQHGDVPFRASASLEVNWDSAHINLDNYRFERRPAAPAAA
jgi:hypothetical protein